MKHLVLAFALATTVSLASSGTASAVGTQTLQPATMARITRHYGTTAWQTPKVATPAKAAAVTAAPTPPVQEAAPAPVDPNGCEAQGMHYRADNNECIPKLVTLQQTAPATVLQPAAGGCELARSLINQYSWPTEVAYQVMTHESGCNSRAANMADNHGSCMGSYGLLQVACFWYPYYGYALEQGYSPEVNIAVAHKIWERSGSFAAWTTCAKVPGCR